MVQISNIEDVGGTVLRRSSASCAAAEDPKGFLVCFPELSDLSDDIIQPFLIGIIRYGEREGGVSRAFLMARKVIQGTLLSMKGFI